MQYISYSVDCPFTTSGGILAAAVAPGSGSSLLVRGSVSNVDKIVIGPNNLPPTFLAIQLFPAQVWKPLFLSRPEGSATRSRLIFLFSLSRAP